MASKTVSVLKGITFLLIAINKKVKFDGARCLSRHFCVSKVITTVHAHKSAIIFHIFPKAFTKKLSSTTKMTKIAARGSGLKHVNVCSSDLRSLYTFKILTVGVFYLVFLSRISAEDLTLAGPWPTMIESVSLEPSLNDQKKFDVDISINLKKNLPYFQYSNLKKNPESTLGVKVTAERLDDIAVSSNKKLINNVDPSSGSQYRLELEERGSDMGKPVTYHVSVKSLWEDELYNLNIAAKSERRLFYVTFRSV